MISQVRAKIAGALRRRLGFPDQFSALRRLYENGFAPKVILDVGASYGIFIDEAATFWPSAEVHCFEPEPEYVERLAVRAKADPRIHVCGALVGAVASDDVQYHFHLGASSVLATHVAQDQKALSPLPVRLANMVTLHDYCTQHRLSPEMLKIDVQGYELEVLKGAGDLLSEIEVILTEVNHIEIYAGAPLAGELIQFMCSRGFALHDICNFMRRPLDHALWQTDMIFVRHDSALRAAKYWN